MKTRFAWNQGQPEAGEPQLGRFLDAPARLRPFGKDLHVNIWAQGHIWVTLTTISPASHHGIPVLRVKHPAYEESIDLGPADFAPCREDEPPETAAELLLHIHAKRPLTGEALDGARRFLGQCPEGPQLPDRSASGPADSMHSQGRDHSPTA